MGTVLGTLVWAGMKVVGGVSSLVSKGVGIVGSVGT